jgi:CHAT domain-containing protein/tetratricopeptide (TPR) repeat protein
MVQPHSNTSQHTDRKNYRAWFLNCFLVLATSLFSESIHAYPNPLFVSAGQDEERFLEAGKPIERDVAGGQSHSYRISLAAGQYFKVEIDQRGNEMAVKLFTPDGKNAIEEDPRFNKLRKLTVEWLAEEAGDYRLEVVTKQKLSAAGRYQVQIVELRAGTGLDRELHEARKLYAEFDRLFRAGKMEEAIQEGERELAITEKVLGPHHINVARSLNSLAITYEIAGDHTRCEAMYRRALEINEKAFGPRHLEVGRILYNLGTHYFELGDVRKAESYYERSLDITEAELGAEHLIVAVILNDLGSVYGVRENNAKAEAMFRRALAIREKLLGPDHIDSVETIAYLATSYSNRGDYATAESYYARVLEILEKTLGPEHRFVAVALLNFAVHYSDRGDYVKSESFGRRALAIVEKLEPNDPMFTWPLDQLGNVYSAVGDSARAEPLVRRVLELREKTLGEDHPELAHALSNMASLHIERGEYEKAEPLLNRALAIFEKMLGPSHTDVARTLIYLAKIHRKRGEYLKAEPLYDRALDIVEKTLGEQHAYAISILNDISMFYAAKGEIGQAIKVLSRANALNERNFELTLALGSERQKLAFLDTYSKRTNFTLSLQSELAPDDADALELAFTTILRRKARGLDAMSDTIAILRRHATEQDRVLLDQLLEARSRLAALTLKEQETVKPDRGLDRVKPETYQTRLDLLREKVDGFEAELSSRSAEFRIQSRPVTLASVQAALSDDSVLVEFAYFTPLDPKTDKDGPPRYLAYLLPAKGRPAWVDLGEAAPIDRAVDDWRKTLRNPNRLDVKRLARAVDEKVMRPVRARLGELPGDARRLLIVPDGSLNLIPFAALVDEENKYLVERYSISYLTSGRDLLRLRTSEPSKSDPLVIANPDFGSPATIAMRGVTRAGGSRARNRARRQFDQLIFRSLPATRDEAVAIKALIPQASVLQEEQASETALKQARGPRILHIATHGFFYNNKQENQAVEKGRLQADSSRTRGVASEQAPAYTVQLEVAPALQIAQERARNLRELGLDVHIVKSEVKSKGVFYRVRGGNFPTQAEAQNYGADLRRRGVVSDFFVARYWPSRARSVEPAPVIVDLRLSKFVAQVKDPLLRSGLALAGANLGRNGDDDGVLTALEAAYLDLSGTKLVVLSACDTGVGELKNGEGVQGLRRALVLAGSESQVMSLWPVSDAAAKDLMIPYYKALQQGEGRSEALRQVQLRILRERRGSRHPFYWAAFIQSGEWSDLDGQR